jgi:hypothetical protein
MRNGHCIGHAAGVDTAHFRWDMDSRNVDAAVRPEGQFVTAAVAPAVDYGAGDELAAVLRAVVVIAAGPGCHMPPPGASCRQAK